MILFMAPSEAKKYGGEGGFRHDSLVFSELSNIRNQLMGLYECNIGSFGDRFTETTGLKKEEDFNKLPKVLNDSLAMKAIERYSGVAFKAIDYVNLNDTAQDYLHKKLFFFSNLFGLISANDLIPYYKLKQGATLDNQKISNHYKLAISDAITKRFENEEILDLSAKYYESFYQCNLPITRVVFLKEGKVVSHHAKHFRGILARMCAQNQPMTIKEFLAISIDGLRVQEIQKKKNIQTIIYSIL